MEMDGGALGPHLPHPPHLPLLHVLTDDAVLARADFVGVGCALLALGVALHLRGWQTPMPRRLTLARELVAGGGHGVLQINDRLDLAMALRTAAPMAPVGVHLPEKAFPAAEARRLLGPGALLGRSVHAPHTEADLDYLVMGTLFATPSHPGRSEAGWALLDRALTPGGIAPVRDMAPDSASDPDSDSDSALDSDSDSDSVPTPVHVPVIGVGGMTPPRAEALRRRGGWGVAVLRGIWDAPDGASPTEAAQGFLDALGALQGASGAQGSNER
jgi:thiamine-phosphate pyrophosphorylase